MQRGRLSGERYNYIVAQILERYRARVELLTKEMMVSGYPPFAEPLTRRQQYDKLVAMKNAGDPRFANSPAAQEALAKLSMQFGAPVELGISPYGVQ